MKIYVGNLSLGATEAALRLSFEAFGEVESIEIVKDKHGNAPKLHAFVEMASQSEGQSAIDGLNGSEFEGKLLKVDEARSAADRRDRRSGSSAGPRGRDSFPGGKGGKGGGGAGFGGPRRSQGGSRGRQGGGRGGQGRSR